MPAFTVHQAEARLSESLAQARDGEDVVIAVDEDPVARIVPFTRGASHRPGALKGKVAPTPALCAPLPAQEVAAWGADILRVSDERTFDGFGVARPW